MIKDPMKRKTVIGLVSGFLLLLVLALALIMGITLAFAQQAPTMGIKFYPPDARVDRAAFQDAYEKALNFLPKDKLRKGLLRVHIGAGGHPNGSRILYSATVAEVWLRSGSIDEFIRALALLVSVRKTNERKMEIGRKIAKAIGQGDPYAP